MIKIQNIDTSVSKLSSIIFSVDFIMSFRFVSVAILITLAQFLLSTVTRVLFVSFSYTIFIFNFKKIFLYNFICNYYGISIAMYIRDVFIIFKLKEKSKQKKEKRSV